MFFHSHFLSFHHICYYESHHLCIVADSPDFHFLRLNFSAGLFQGEVTLPVCLRTSHSRQWIQVIHITAVGHAQTHSVSHFLSLASCIFTYLHIEMHTAMSFTALEKTHISEGECTRAYTQIHTCRLWPGIPACKQILVDLELESTYASAHLENKQTSGP